MKGFVSLYLVLWLRLYFEDVLIYPPIGNEVHSQGVMKE